MNATLMNTVTVSLTASPSVAVRVDYQPGFWLKFLANIQIKGIPSER